MQIKNKPQGRVIGAIGKNNILEIPDYIKIDVDGNEQLVVNGMDEVLKNQERKQIMIEVDEVINQDNKI